ncbi:MAG: ATP-binding protein [Bacteriovoracaceae bacterium]
MKIVKSTDLKINPKILTIGQSGAGKTTSIGTLGLKTLVLDFESGTLPLYGNKNIDIAAIHSIEELREAFKFVSNGHDYKAIAIDSLTDASDLFLKEAEKKFPSERNTMQKFGEVQKLTKDFLNYLKHLKQIVIVNVLAKDVRDDVGRRTIQPDIIGSLRDKAPAFFDIVLGCRIVKKDDEEKRFFQTFNDEIWPCKDRSSKLEKFEEMNYQNILTKINGGK